jgi:poly-gamma-glutamate synthesis protein (capsule biosynthesis protein)
MIRLLFCGDFFGKSLKNIDISDDVLEILQKCDVRACYFEAPVANEGNPVQKSGPILCQSIESPGFIEKMGFNVIQLSNNHIFDYQKEGLIKTQSLFKTALLLGAGQFEEAYQIKKLEVCGKVIGFMSLSHYEFGVLGNNSADNSFGCAWINHPIVNKNIINARKSVDYLFVLPHAGVENIDAPLPEWRTRYKEFIDLGADAVVASHPHVPQGWEFYNGKPIFYSLGNFYFETSNRHVGKYWNKCLIVETSISENREINYVVYNIKNDDGFICRDDSIDIQNHTRTICALVQDEDKYLDYINGKALQVFKDYFLYFLIGLRAFSFQGNLLQFVKSLYNTLFRKQNIPLLINCIRCESHRWIILRALELLLRKSN